MGIRYSSNQHQVPKAKQDAGNPHAILAFYLIHCIVFISACATTPTPAQTSAPPGTRITPPATQTLEGGWSYHEQPLDGFVVALPATWQAYDLSSDTSAEIIQKGYERSTELGNQLNNLLGVQLQNLGAALRFIAVNLEPGDFSTNVNLNRFKLPNRTTLDAYVLLAKQDLAKTSNVIQIISNQRVSIAAGPAEEVLLSMDVRDASGRLAKVQSMQYWVIKDLDIWTLTFTTNENQFEKYAPVFRKIGFSFRFIPQDFLAVKRPTVTVPSIPVTRPDVFATVDARLFRITPVTIPTFPRIPTADLAAFSATLSAAARAPTRPALPAVLPTPSGTLLLADDFLDNKNGWDVTSGAYIENKSYNIKVPVDRNGDLRLCYFQCGPFTDFSYEAVISKVEGIDQGRGLIFRMSPEPYKTYGFFIDEAIWAFMSYSPGGSWNVILSESSLAINRGSSRNKIRVNSRGSKFEFYINDELVGSSTDGYSSSGYVGVMVLGPGTHIRVESVRVWSEK